MDEKIKRIEKWAKGKQAGPFLIEVWPTNRCNLRCWMCGTWAHRRRLKESGIEYNPRNEMQLEVKEERLLKLVEEAHELDAKEFLITGGGEPFVRKETTLKLMKKIKDFNMAGNLNTNGTLLSERDIKKIVQMGWDRIMFSIDAPNSRDNDFIRGVKGTFKKAKTTLKLFKQYKKRFSSEKPHIVFNTVLTNKIFDKIKEMIVFASEVGCEDVTFIPLIIYDDSVKILEMNEEQNKIFQANLDEAIELSLQIGVNTNLFHLKKSSEDVIMPSVETKTQKNLPPCFEPFLHFLVKGNGEATFCCMVEGSPENIKEKSLSEIWFGEYFEEERKNFVEKKIREECKFCVFTQSIRNREIGEKLLEFKVF